MSQPLEKKHVLVCVGGGIAAFKAVGLVRELQRAGAEVRVAMTASATRFVGEVTFAGLTGKKVATDLWDPSFAGELHVELAGWADVIVVAPATMNLMARLATGQANDVVLATLACRQCSVVLAPAMHTRMWERASTQRNVAVLREDGVHIVGPVSGALASGESGEGRMSEPAEIAEAVSDVLVPLDLRGRRVLISAGPTLEDIDPVRFLGNRSSGKMGYALARAAASRGAEVVLVSGPTSLACPSGVRRVDVRSALEMLAAITSETADVVIMAAAVADYRPTECASQKRKKTDGPLTIELVRNPDILASLGQARQGTRPVLVGFAVETENLLNSARGKLTRKRVDLIVANHAKDSFGKDQNIATLVGPEDAEPLEKLSKAALAHKILDRVIRLF